MHVATRFFSILLFIAALPGFLRAQNAGIPEELMEDDHFLEEFGVNNLTTPSIGKVFEQLDRFGEIPYEKLKRTPPDKTQSDRTLLAISLGSLIAEGFFTVHSGNINELEPIGRAILGHATAMGAGGQITRHAKPLIEHSRAGDSDKLRKELTSTQKDVQIEMVTLRDEDAVHLIGFGGWLRAFEVACDAALDPFTEERAEILKRIDIVEYYVAEFETLEPSLAEKDYIKQIRQALAELQQLLDIPDEEALTEENVKQLQAKVAELTKAAFPGAN